MSLLWKFQVSSKERLLYQRLAARPYHKRSLFEYVDILYSKGDYESAIQYIERILKLEDINPSSYHIKLGKCRYRAWKRSKDRDLQEIQKCIDSYLLAFEDPVVQRNKSPIHYFELSSMYTRLGDYGSAMEVLNTISTLYAEEVEYEEDIKEGLDSNTIMYLVQYNAAQLSLTTGRVAEALEIYQELLLHDVDLQFDPGTDHALFSSYRFFNQLATFEMGRALQLLGNERFAQSMLRESWSRMVRYNRKTVILDEKHTVDLTFGVSSFEEWYGRHHTYQMLADIYMRESNLIMAAEMYGRAAELLSAEGWETLSLENQVQAAQYILTRAELLAELCSFDQAEFCAHYVFEKLPYDIVVVGRAARCCRPTVSENFELIAAGATIFRAVRKVRKCLGLLVLRSRHKQKIYLGLCASKIIALFRMAHTRLHFVQSMLSNVSILHTNLIAASLQKRMLKRGLAAVLDWVELWATSATRIQHMIRHWLHRRKFSLFFNGFQSLKRIYKGQLERVRIREVIQSIQDRLSQNNVNSTLNREEALALTENLRSVEDMNLHNLSRVRRLSSGIILITLREGSSSTAKRNEDVPTFAIKSRKDRLRPGFDLAAHQYEQSDYDHDELFRTFMNTRTEASYERFSSTESLIFEDPSSILSARSGNSGILSTSLSFSSNQTSNSPFPAGSRSRSRSVLTGKSIINSYLDNKSIAGLSKTAPPEKHRVGHASSSVGGSSKYQSTHTSPKSSKLPSASSIRNVNDLEYENDDHTVDTINTLSTALVGRPRRDMGTTWFRTNRSTTKPQNSKIEVSNSSQMMRQLSTSQVTQLELLTIVKRIVASNSSDDVISQLSIKNMENDPSLLWVPLGILPAAELQRLLTCTVLVLSSSSMSMNDCKRIARFVKKKEVRDVTWANIRSLSVYGTKIGPSGLLGLLDIGISHMRSLSIGHVGMTYSFGKLLGKQLMPSTCNLTKLYIESEIQFGDRGFCLLLQHLQQNRSLKLLSVRLCRLTRRSAIALARYLPIAAALETVILNDNLFSFDDMKTIIRAIANAGIRGKLSSVSLRGQLPALNFDQTLELFNFAGDLSIRFMSDMIPCRVETIEEIVKGRDLDEITIHRMESIIKKVSESQAKSPHRNSKDVDNILHNSTFYRTFYL